MRFNVERTSNTCGEVSPCDGAIEISSQHLYDDVYCREWEIEIATLDDLMALHRAHGKLVIKTHQSEMPTIEIYDDYRE